MPLKFSSFFFAFLCLAASKQHPALCCGNIPFGVLPQLNLPQIVPPPATQSSSSQNRGMHKVPGQNNRLLSNTILQTNNGGAINLEKSSASAVSGPIQEPQELACYDFDDRCRWRNVEGFLTDELDWHQGFGLMNEERLRLSTGTSRPPDGYFAIAATDNVESVLTKAILMSDVIDCQEGKAELRFNYWTSPSVKIVVCTKTLNKPLPFYDYCARPIENGDPGPATVTLPDMDCQPFQIVIQATNFLYKSESIQGGFAIIDNLEYNGDLCRQNGAQKTTEGDAFTPPFAASKNLKSSNALGTHGLIHLRPTNLTTNSSGNLSSSSSSSSSTSAVGLRIPSSFSSSASSFNSNKIATTLGRTMKKTSGGNALLPLPVPPPFHNIMGRNSGNATAYLNNLVEWMISNVAGGGGAAKNNTSSLSSTASSSGADRLTNFVSGLGRQISALSTLSTIASPIEISSSAQTTSETTTAEPVEPTTTEESPPQEPQEELSPAALIKSFPIDRMPDEKLPPSQRLKTPQHPYRPQIQVKHNKVVKKTGSSSSAAKSHESRNSNKGKMSEVEEESAAGGEQLPPHRKMPHMQLLIQRQKQQLGKSSAENHRPPPNGDLLDDHQQRQTMAESLLADNNSTVHHQRGGGGSNKDENKQQNRTNNNSNNGGEEGMASAGGNNNETMSIGDTKIAID